jgi:hypothetical protein
MENAEPGIPPALLRTTPAAVCHYIAAAGWPGQIIHIGHTTPPELQPVQAMAALAPRIGQGRIRGRCSPGRAFVQCSKNGAAR